MSDKRYKTGERPKPGDVVQHLYVHEGPITLLRPTGKWGLWLDDFGLRVDPALCSLVKRVVIDPPEDSGAGDGGL